MLEQKPPLSQRNFEVKVAVHKDAESFFFSPAEEILDKLFFHGSHPDLS